MRITRAVREAAANTAKLAALFGSDNAAGQAIEAAVVRAEQDVVKSVIARAEAAAKNMTGELDPGVAYVLLWFAEKLRSELTPDSREPYAPRDGDCIQVTFTGDLRAFEVFHPSIGKETVWELTTDEGMVIPMTEDDFGTLEVERLLGDD